MIKLIYTPIVSSTGCWMKLKIQSFYFWIDLFQEIWLFYLREATRLEHASSNSLLLQWSHWFRVLFVACFQFLSANWNRSPISRKHRAPKWRHWRGSGDQHLGGYDPKQWRAAKSIASAWKSLSIRTSLKLQVHSFYCTHPCILPYIPYHS